MSNDHPTTPGLPEDPGYEPPAGSGGGRVPGPAAGPAPDADGTDLPPRDPSEFDSWFADEPVRPMPSVDGIPPTPHVPSYGTGAYPVADEGAPGGAYPPPGDTRAMPAVDPESVPPPTAEPAAAAADVPAAALPKKAGRRSLIGAFGSPTPLASPGGTDAFRGTAEGDDDAGDRTMTTRVSIKIPGSRPIPPVVLRGQAPLAPDGDPGPYGGWDEADDHEFGADAPRHQPAPAGQKKRAAPMSPARRRKRMLIVGSAAGIALLGGIYGGSLAYAGGGVPRGTSVLGVDIGGQSKSEAVRTLESVLGDRATGPFPVKIGDKELMLDPPNSGLILDAESTVDRAAHRSLNPLESVPAMFGSSRTVKPATIEDPAKLAAALEQLAADAGEHAREGGVSFDGGKATAIAPQTVRVLDTPAAVEAVRSAYMSGGPRGPVVLPTKQSTPKVSQEEVDRAMREFAVPAMSGPVTLTAGKASMKLEPATLAKYLSMVPDANGKLVPKIDTAGLQEALGNSFSTVGQKPVDATFKVDNGKVSVVPSKPGQGVSGDTAAQALMPVLTKTSGRTAAVALGPVEPAFTTAKAQALGITDVLATYTTNYPYAQYRLTNIHRAADLVDGGVVMPGDTWSLNKTVGERTAENGFAKGTIINNGRFQTDFGGGVSQVATTMFNAVFFAGLKDVQHKPHSFWIDRYPAGREATVAWPSLDLKWQNDSGKPVYIDTSYTDNSVTVTLLGTKKYDQIKSTSSPKYDLVEPKAINDTSAGCVPQGPSQGFKIDVTRIFVQGGREVRREQFHTKYDPADAITCGPPAPGGAAAPPGVGSGNND
ncbi:hypothetical protein GCM10023205_29950 [Yinghuangia aomiensis]|uniref:YoaR-like putative peptidoglycan binding domain-containing protein n=1 Tax=Yinghuangia aomiensis TaxID=676205 RepID=A0ABP9H8K2_9ACTN